MQLGFQFLLFCLFVGAEEFVPLPPDYAADDAAGGPPQGNQSKYLKYLKYSKYSKSFKQ